MKSIAKKFLSIVLVSLVAVSVLAENIAVKPADRKGEWWPKRHAEKLELAKKNDADVLLVGDSITHTWDHNMAIWKEVFPKCKMHNIGFSGDRTEHVIWRLQNGAADNITPKLAIVMIGTNNTGHRKEPPEDTAEGIKVILKELTTRLPKVKVLLLAVFPRSPRPADAMRKQNEAINKIISNYADNKTVFYLDINSIFLDDQGNIPKTIMKDALHPGTEGYRMWAKAMKPMVEKLLN